VKKIIHKLRLPDAARRAALKRTFFIETLLYPSTYCILKMQYAIGLNSMGPFYDHLFKLCYNKFLLIFFFYVLRNILIGHLKMLKH
jgi:hypothetical protein